jgi:hypothetical protein
MEEIQLAYKDLMYLPSTENVKLAVCTNLFDLLISARNHEDLIDAMLICQLWFLHHTTVQTRRAYKDKHLSGVSGSLFGSCDELINLFPNLELLFMRLKINLVSAFSNIITVIQQNLLSSSLLPNFFCLPYLI